MCYPGGGRENHRERASVGPVRTETEILVASDSSLVGVPCTRCGQLLAAGDRAVVCPRCRAPHHSRCWMEHGGCARQGCRQVAVAVVLPRDRRPGPPVPTPAPWWRRPAILAGAALAILAVAALGLTRFGTRPAGAPVASVRLMTWAAPEEARALEEAVARFSAEHPGVEVRLDLTPSIAYEQKLIVLIAARDAPDVFALDPSRLPLFAEQGALLDLTARWEQAPSALKQAPWARRLDAFRVGGRLWGLPHPFSPGALVIAAQSRQADVAWQLLLFLMERLPPPERPPEALPGLAPGAAPLAPPGF